MNRFASALHVAFGRAWAIRPDTLELMAEVVLRRASGEHVAADLPELTRADAARSYGERIGRQDVGGVAVIPVRDVIVPRHNLMTWLFGGTSLEELQGATEEAIADPDVRAIVLDVDSPGGSVDGLAEFAGWLRSARARGTYIAAHADYLMASAAYYIAAQAHEVAAAPSSLVGSVGTVAVHRDFSRMEDAAGITTTIIASDPRKVQTHPLQPLSDEGRAEIQAIVDHAAAQFVADVAKGRGITAADVRDKFGGGAVLLPEPARAAGMVDRIEPIGATVNRLSRGGARVATRRAAGEQLDLAALVAAMTDPDEEHTPEPPPVEGELAPEAAPAPVAAPTRSASDRIAAWSH